MCIMVVMSEKPVIPPIPEDRPGKYRWITEMVALGFKVGAACKMAGVPTVSYYKIGRKAHDKKGEAA